MKLSDYVIKFIEEHGITTIFGYQGSSISHTIDSISKSSIRYIESRHEQGAAFAACGYSQATNQPSVAIACSGPGALNLVTGIADAWYDSLPVMFITGQVSQNEIRTDLKMRQLGFQETDIISIVKPITKYAVTIQNPIDILKCLQEAWDSMVSGRMGPVLIDIPHNIQTAAIDVDNLTAYDKECVPENNTVTDHYVCEEIQASRRPLIIVGGGVENDGLVAKFAALHHIPIVCSYRGINAVNHDDSTYLGVIGVYGNRYANIALHHADLVISVGSRLDGRQLGTKIDNFELNKKIIAIDIDEHELQNLQNRCMVCCRDYRIVFSQLLSTTINNDFFKWYNTVLTWKTKYSSEKEFFPKEGCNPNYIIKSVSNQVTHALYTTDVGQNQIWTNQSIHLGTGSKLIQSCGLGAMGYSLPAAIGAHFSGAYDYLVAFCGDGGFQMNIQELQTAHEYKIPLKIIIFNNSGLGLIRVYQDKALQGNHIGSVNGFSNPDYRKIAEAYGFDYCQIKDCNQENDVTSYIKSDRACIIEVIVSNDSQSYPEQAYKMPVYCQNPLLTEEDEEAIQKEVYDCEEI